MNIPSSINGAPLVSAAELRRNFGVWQDRAMRTPVLVLRHGKPRLMLCSAEQFQARTPEQAVNDAVAGIPEHTSEGFIVLDRELNILAVNRVFEDACSLHSRQLVGGAWPEIFPAAAASVIGAHFRQVLRTAQACQFDTPSMVTADRHYRISVFPHAEGIAALFVNRTAEELMRGAEEERLSIDACFALLPNIAQVGINLRGYVRRASPQFRTMTGYDADQMGAPRFVEIVTPAHRPAVGAAIETVLSGHETDRLRAELLTHTGETLAVEIAIAPLWRGCVPDGATAFISRA